MAIARNQTPAKVAPGSQKPPSIRGSRKGSPNKNTTAIKDMILQALSNVGGVEYLERRANDPKTAAAFLGLIGKVMPMQVVGADGGALEHAIRVEFIKPTE